MEAIGTLAGGIAHDFNNILSAIIGYTELALTQTAADSQLYLDLRAIRAASDRAAGLIRQILAFSRRSDCDRHPIQITSLVKETLKLLRASIPKAIQLNQKIETELPAINADPSEIHQVLVNLCANATQAMGEHQGTLGVSLKPVSVNGEAVHFSSIPQGSYLELVVADTGPGMTPDILDQIFEPYFTTKDKGKGTGLGLAVVHGIVTDLGGHIVVESAPELGSTFRVYLPALTASQA